MTAGSGHRALQAEVHRLLHLAAHVVGDAVGVFGGQRPFLHQAAAEARDRVAALGRLVLLGRAEDLDRLVVGEVQRHARRRDDVAVSAEAVDLGLHERRAVAGACSRHRLPDRPVNEHRVAAVDGHARDAVRAGLDRQILAGRAIGVLLLGAGDDVVAVVLHHEDDGQLPQRRQVERFVERALLGGAVAEERKDDLALPADLRRPGGAGGLGDALPDDPRGAEEAALGVGEVHRAAESLAQPGRATVDLGHHRLRRRAEDDRVAVTAVGRQDLVAGAQRGERADDRGLRAVGEVRVAADDAWVLLEGALDALLELADAQHLREHPQQAVAVGLGVAHGTPLIDARGWSRTRG